MLDQLENDEEISALQQKFSNSYICPKTQEKIYNSFVYEFPYEEIFTQETLLQFVKSAIVSKTAKQGYISQKPPKYQKISKKIVGQNFKQEVLDNDKDQAIFFYSKHCLGCKKYGPFFEQLALKNLINPNYFNNIQFKRMNDDCNANECLEGFTYTPVFAIFKNESKRFPIVYRNNTFTSENFFNFFEVINKVQFINATEVINQLQNLNQVYRTKFLI